MGVLDTTVKALYCEAPKFALAPKKETKAQAEGRRYEGKVRSFLIGYAATRGYDLKDHPWIAFSNGTSYPQYCQPDYVLLSKEDDNMLIIDAKLRHTRDVVAQLRRYRRILASIHPEFTPSLVEICRYFDPAECRMALLSELKPHDYELAAVIFEPREWNATLN